MRPEWLGERQHPIEGGVGRGRDEGRVRWGEGGMRVGWGGERRDEGRVGWEREG